MKLRRRMAFPKLGTTLYLAFELWPSKQKFATSDIGRLRAKILSYPLSFGNVGSMSALAHFADSNRTSPEDGPPNL
jgi:hypothetical protein